MRMDTRYMTKQRCGQITTSSGLEMEVFTTGQPSWYLFCPMQEVSPGTFVSGTIQTPYHNRDLVKGWKHRLH